MKKLIFLLLLSLPASAAPITFAERDAFWKTLSNIEMCFDTEVGTDGITRLWTRMKYDIVGPGGYVIHYYGKTEGWDFIDLLGKKFTLRDVLNRVNINEGVGNQGCLK